MSFFDFLNVMLYFYVTKFCFVNRKVSQHAVECNQNFFSNGRL
jgi:hypothetical protein